jgi:hypothetical protein
VFVPDVRVGEGRREKSCQAAPLEDELACNLMIWRHGCQLRNYAGTERFPDAAKSLGSDKEAALISDRNILNYEAQKTDERIVNGCKGDVRQLFKVKDDCFDGLDDQDCDRHAGC